MKSFFKYVFATIVGILLLNIILFLLFLGLIASIAPSEKPVKIKPNSILHLKLDYAIDERTNDNPFKSISFTNFKSEKNLGLNDILFNLHKAAEDPNIKAIYLDVTNFEAGMATVEEIRNAILTFRRESKKPVIAYTDYYTQLSYYLCSAADKIYMNPQGVVEFKGLSSEILFFKNALEKLGIEPIVIRHGKFKSAVEPFILDKMSPENKEQTITYVKSIWDYMLSQISQDRGIPVERLNIIADSLLLDNADNCVKYGFVDGLKYYDEILKEFCQLSKVRNSEHIAWVEMNEYSKVPAKYVPGQKDKIAVLYAVGQIDMGKSEDDKIGGNDLAEEIRKVRENKSIKALVLRVNSPGGSALASEVIWREVLLTKKVKPVIVSMGDVAASGGYYISCPADVIVANPTTITGSIGVFGLMWNGQKLLNDKLGLTVDGVQTNENSNLGSVFRPIKPYEQQVIQKGVEQIYGVFISHVADGRKKTTAEVDSIGQGRVWSGVNAKQIGLIDEFGGLEKAIEIAKDKAGIKGKIRLIELPEKLPFFEQILKDMQENTQTSILEKEFGPLARYVKSFKQLNTLKGVQARMPYDIYIY
ncbi:MAG TPA: signal peptide peptidase SppA [Bacteroidales bacterium]|nr:signal peptide peptidase SppA [Bacteroidales bacterium]